MKNRCFYILIFSLILFSCNKKSKDIDNFYIPSNQRVEKEKLTLILKDMFLLESAIHFKTNYGYDIKSLTTVYYNQLFKLYDTNKDEIVKSLNYYVFYDKSFSEVIENAKNMLIVEADSIKEIGNLEKIENENLEDEEAENSADEKGKRKISFFGMSPE